MCSHSVVKLHEATEMFVMVENVRKMTVSVKKSSRNGKYGSFDHFLFLVKKIDVNVKSMVFGLMYLMCLLRNFLHVQTQFAEDDITRYNVLHVCMFT